jgi:hypothetical protein
MDQIMFFHRQTSSTNIPLFRSYARYRYFVNAFEDMELSTSFLTGEPTVLFWTSFA